MNQTEVLNLAKSIVAKAKAGEEVEVACSNATTTTVRVYDGAVESLSSADSQSVGVRVLSGGSEGFASAGTFDEAVLNDVLQQARDNATYAEPDEHAGIAKPDDVEAVMIDLWSDSVPELSTEAKIDIALDIERRTKAADSRITGIRTASYGDSVGVFALASSAGIETSDRATSASVSVQGLADDGDRTQAGYGYDAARGVDELDLASAVRRAVRNTVELLGAQQGETAEVDLVLEPEMVATVLGLIAGTLSGDKVLKGRSPFADRRSEIVASPALTMLDDPTRVGSLGSSSFDGEGLACRPVPLITQGVLDGFVHDSYTGRRSGDGSTGSAVRSSRSLPRPGVQALAVLGGERSAEDIIGDTKLGLFVFGMAGLHSGVNPVSGDFSVGVEGRMIRDGELAEPVAECTISSTLQNLLLSISEFGNDVVELPSGVSTSSARITGVSLSGKGQKVA